MKKTALMGWVLAVISFVGAVRAETPAPQRAAARSEAPVAANGQPALVPALAQARPKVTKSVVVAVPAAGARAPADDAAPYGTDETEGDDGADGAGSESLASAASADPVAAARKTVAPNASSASKVPSAPNSTMSTSAASLTASAPVVVDAAMINSMLANMNQSMRRGVTVQVTKLPKGVSLAYVSDDPKIVERLQQMADGMRLIRDAWSE